MATKSGSRDALQFPPEKWAIFEPYLPTPQTCPSDRAWCTLTYACSLDSQIALAPGLQTALSGPESKAMTHYLRSKHDAILIGEGTMRTDNPSLNCRLEGSGGYGGTDLENHPTPIVLSPTGSWLEWWDSSKIYKLAKEKKGKMPYILTSSMPERSLSERAIQELGGIVEIPPTATTEGAETSRRFDWQDILIALKCLGFSSVMVEGGGRVINSLLEPRSQRLIDSTIVTIAPTWLGNGGVTVSPERRTNGHIPVVGRLKKIVWCPLGEDVVLCGKICHTESVEEDKRLEINRQEMAIIDKDLTKRRKAILWTRFSSEGGQDIYLN